jgi:hypothetical protein
MIDSGAQILGISNDKIKIANECFWIFALQTRGSGILVTNKDESGLSGEMPRNIVEL